MQSREELLKKYKTEKVLCIENKYLPNNLKSISIVDLLEKMSFRCFSQLRADAEIDVDSRQIIPYVVIRTKKSDGNVYVFTTTRLKGDERLKGQKSIGTGGHVDVSDIVMQDIEQFKINIFDTIENCIKRELSEETTLKDIEKLIDGELELVNLFIDDRSEVSKVHLCMLFTLDIPESYAEELTIKETEKLVGEWINIKDIKKIKKLEGWSEKAYELLQQI